MSAKILAIDTLADFEVAPPYRPSPEDSRLSGWRHTSTNSRMKDQQDKADEKQNPADLCRHGSHSRQTNKPGDQADD